MSDIERIKAVINWSGLSSNAFAKRIGYASGGSIYNKNNGSRDVNLKLITKIANEFPVLNKDWLLTGKGQMLNNTDSTIPDPNNQIINNQNFDTMTLDAINRMLAIIEKQQDDIHLANLNVRMAMENQANLISRIPGGTESKKAM